MEWRTNASLESSVGKPATTETAAAKGAYQRYVMAHASLRILACLVTAAAALTMGLNKETSNILGFEIQASLKTSPTFKFFVVGNAIAACYDAISLIFLCDLKEGFFLHILDLVNLCLVVAAASATAAIGYVGKYGNDEIGWSKVCMYYEKFCSRTGIAVALSYTGVVLLLLICAFSIVNRTKVTLPLRV